MKKLVLVILSIPFFVFNLSAQHSETAKRTPVLFESVVDVSQIFQEQELRKKMKEDGLSDVVIDKLIEERKRLEAQGRKVNWSSYSANGNKIYANSCSDMGVENGWGSWMGATGSNIGGNPAALGAPTIPVTPQFNITSGNGIDPCTPGVNPADPSIPVVASGFGSASIQLGQPQTAGGVVEQLTFPLTVTINDTNFIYSYALVLYDAGFSHAPNEMPFAEFLILAPNGDTVVCSYKHFISGSSIQGFYQANSSCLGGTNTWYKPWTTSGVNLAAYVGQSLLVVITNGDCVQGGHFAHSYWDFSCGYNDVKFCTGQQTTLCAPASDPSSPFTYQWFKNGAMIPAAANQCLIANPQHSDTMSVYIGQPSGCDFYVNYIMLDSCLLGAADNSLLSAPNIYPSPASKNIFLDFDGKDLGKARVSFCNILGEELYSTLLPASGKQMLDISGYKEGIYFVKIKTDSGDLTKKIIIAR